MKREVIEWGVISTIVFILLILGFQVKDLNSKSFNNISQFMYLVKSDVGNLRRGPSVDEQVVGKMQQYDKIEFLRNKRKLRSLLTKKVSYEYYAITDHDWYKLKYLRTGVEGWAHKSILGKYLSLGYGSKRVVGHSVFEVEW